MKSSISRDSSIKHSTGNNDTMSRKTHRRRPRVKTSTGEKATVTHFTGRMFDMKREEQAEIEAEEQAKKHKPPQAA